MTVERERDGGKERENSCEVGPAGIKTRPAQRVLSNERDSAVLITPCTFLFFHGNRESEQMAPVSKIDLQIWNLPDLRLISYMELKAVWPILTFGIDV